MLCNLIDDFLTDSPELRPTTRRTWRVLLRAYARWVGDAAQVTDINTPMVRRWMDALRDRSARPRTIRAHLCALRALCRWLVTACVLPADPTETIKAPRMDAARRQLVSDDELRDILAATDRLSPLRRSALARALLSVLIYAGLRRQELLDLRLGDVSLGDRSVTVRDGKGGKCRAVYPCTECLQALRTWLRLRGRCGHEWLWALDHGRRVGQAGLSSLMQEVRAAAGLRGAVHIQPHSIRHAAATRMLRNGCDIESVRVFLGHASLATTAIYVHADEERMRAVSETTAFAPAPAVPARAAPDRRYLVRRLRRTA